jgi:hypothetical protein
MTNNQARHARRVINAAHDIELATQYGRPAKGPMRAYDEARAAARRYKAGGRR